MVKFYSSDRSLLFDLSKDINESIDLSKKKKAKVKELEKRLSDYLKLRLMQSFLKVVLLGNVLVSMEQLRRNFLNDTIKFILA